MSKEETVGIAELKARLSHYLREVRAGRPLTVLDRGRAVARLVPVEEKPGMAVRKPPPGTARPGDFEPLPPLGIDVDVMALLNEERGER